MRLRPVGLIAVAAAFATVNCAGDPNLGNPSSSGSSALGSSSNQTRAPQYVVVSPTNPPDPGGGGGGDGGGGGGAPGRGGNPRPTPTAIAMLKWAEGEHCYDSTAAIGEGMPYGAQGVPASINNIAVVTAQNGSSTQAYGFVYTTNAGNSYFEANPSAGDNFWTALAGAIPVVGALVHAWAAGGANAVTPISTAQYDALANQINAADPGAKANTQPCFTSVPAPA